MPTAQNQHTLTTWFRTTSPAQSIMDALIWRSPSDMARLAHLKSVVINGPDLIYRRWTLIRSLSLLPWLCIRDSTPWLSPRINLNYFSSFLLLFHFPSWNVSASVIPPSPQMALILCAVSCCKQWIGQASIAEHNHIVEGIFQEAVIAGLI